MRRILPFAAACVALLASSPAASATIYGVEANSELINSDRSRASQAATLDTMRAQGARVVRVNLGWNEIATDACASQSPSALRDHTNSCYDWRVTDGVVQEARLRGIQVLASVSRAPSWLHGRSPSWVGATNTQWSRTLMHYSSFMRAIAQRYTSGSIHGTINLWTVWNEPNSATFWAPMGSRTLRSLAPRRYAQMFAQASIAIRNANSRAKVALGPTGPNSTIKPIDFVRATQQWLPRYLPGTGSTERRYISAWAHNPYPGTSAAPSRGRVRAPAVGMTNIRDLFRQLDRSSLTRGKTVWATEFAYQTNPPDRVLGISPALHGRYIAESFDWLDSTRRVSIAIWYGLTDPVDLADWQGGTYFADGTPKVGLKWWMRPISVPANVVRRGSSTRIWARSMVNPRATRIQYSYDGRRWRLLSTTGRRRDGTTVRNVRMTRKTWFRTYDGRPGPARVVRVR